MHDMFKKKKTKNYLWSRAYTDDGIKFKLKIDYNWNHIWIQVGYCINSWLWFDNKKKQD